tara:strand:- start:939 stop:1307 length:369 start_codon:yes stop_codon:yes gene_type:complete
LDSKDKQIQDIWQKYRRVLTQLEQALDELESRPKTLEEFAETNDALRNQLNELTQWKVRGKQFKLENDKLRDQQSIPVTGDPLSKDYWGRPKVIDAKPSKKNIQQDDYIKNLTKKQTDTKIK